MNYLIQYTIALWNLTSEMAPYLLLGFLVAGWLKVFFPARHMERLMGRNSFRSVLWAALLGIPMPLCSCGVVPTGVSFYRNGASRGATVSFLISTPQTGVDSILATYAMLGGPLAIIRPVVALFTGLGGGWLTNKLERKDETRIPVSAWVEASEPRSITRKIGDMLRYAFVDFLQDIMKWLVIGLFIAAAIELLIPNEFFSNYGGQGFTGMLLMLVASVPMYVCATASVPIAAVLLAKGLAPGAVLVFLMAGPATNAATITVLSKALGRKSFLVYLFSIVAGALVFGSLVNLLPAEWFQPVMHAQQHTHRMLPQAFSVATAVVLLVLLLNSFRLRYFSNRTQKPIEQMSNSIEIRVNGMECRHCQANVEKNIGAMEGVNAVSVNLQESTVVIGGNVDLEAVAKLVNELGYEYGGVVHKLSI